MNKICLSALFFSLCLFSCNRQAETTTPETDATETAARTLGTDFTEDNLLSVTQLQDAVADQDSVQATVAGEIVESCQSKGCWMDVRLADNSTMKVTFRDYGFFLPVEDLKGRSVVFTGTAKREVVSIEDLRHYAEDAGKSAAEISAITAPQEELRFVADGVKLR